jgi:hypothetical protein
MRSVDLLAPKFSSFQIPFFTLCTLDESIATFYTWYNTSQAFHKLFSHSLARVEPSDFSQQGVDCFNQQSPSPSFLRTSAQQLN